MTHLYRLLCGAIVLVLVGSCSSLPKQGALRTDVTRTETANYVALSSNQQPPRRTGILFYPGGFVDPNGYEAPLQDLAAKGYPVITVKVTGNLAIWNIGKAETYRAAFPNVDHWVLAGHSLGGAVACRDILQEREVYKGLVLWAAFPGNAARMDDWEGAVLSLYGENDALADPAEVLDNRVNLPPALEVDDLTQFPTSPTRGQTVYYEIKGGNHAQFGSYGEQEGDGEATIPQARQHELIVEAMEQFFNANQWP